MLRFGEGKNWVLGGLWGDHGRRLFDDLKVILVKRLPPSSHYTSAALSQTCSQFISDSTSAAPITGPVHKLFGQDV